MSDLNKLRWRCRRGTLELDRMLIRYLENCYRDADSREQQAFLQLLKMEDSELTQYLLGERVPANPQLQRVTLAIRTRPE